MNSTRKFANQDSLEDAYTLIRNLTRQVTEVKTQVASVLPSVPSSSNEVIPAMVNFADNSDFIYSDIAYNPTHTYTDSDEVLAGWYYRAQATATSYGENSGGAQATGAIVSADHSSPSSAVQWEKGTGSILFTGGLRIAHRLSAQVAQSGNYMVCRMELSNTGVADIISDLILKVSIWDNTDNKILQGTRPTLTPAKQGTHSGGTHTRKYILETIMPDGTTFYTDLVSPANVVNCVSIGTVDQVNYVTVEYQLTERAKRYRVYRQEDSGNWYLLETVVNGANSINDFGGIGVAEWTVPTPDTLHKEYQVADAYVLNAARQLQKVNRIVNFAIPIYIPSRFVINGNQFLQIEFLYNDFNESDDEAINPLGIRLDKVGFSRTNGKWMESAHDQTLLPVPTVPSTPIDTGGSGGNEGNPACVTPDTLIMLWDRTEIPAGSVVEGDTLLSWNGKEYIPSIVQSIIYGRTSSVFCSNLETTNLQSSSSHRVIYTNSLKAANVYGLANLNKEVFVYREENPVLESYISWDWLSIVSEVITFELEEGKHVYFANRVASHNLKPILPDF